MKTLEESIAAAMDTKDMDIVPFLPYILQDFWEMGTPPGIVIELIQKQYKNYPDLNVLDLGCGKGAVSVKLASALRCHCYGIDCIPEFIEASRNKAIEYQVDSLCQFEVADIRERIKELGKYDIIILGSIGPVFGDYYSTLTVLSKHLSAEGIIIIDDAYLNDTNALQDSKSAIYDWVLPRQQILKQIRKAEMELIDEFTGKYSEFAESTKEMESITIRCNELKAKYPGKSSLFDKYEQDQIEGYDALDNDLIGSVMVVKRKVNR